MMMAWKAAVCGLILCVVLGGCGDSKSRGMTVIGRAGDGQAVVTDKENAAGNSLSMEMSQDADDARSSRDGGTLTAESREIRVHVCGAVVSPGVVSLPEDSRAEDALEAAGGFAENAWRDYVNLAERVQDGEKLYFPTLEEAESLVLQEPENGLVNINTADVAALCTLPGIGESRAKDIIAYREANGPFDSCEDIMKVSGIKTSVYNKISDKITVR